ncbi:S8 family serine peptidase [Isoptericola hypogeus]|uniref:S8 family serine peptidase n=1 Tax=Isoptericola hypogeus TaxID=300179 RepID=A0ABN2JI59_9MICO
MRDRGARARASGPRRAAGGAVGTLSAVALVAALAAPPGAAAPAADVAPAAETERARQASATLVTLVTGDRVRVTTRADGSQGPVQILPAERPHGAPVAFRQVAVGDSHYVIPTDVQALVPERLDRDLFDVRLLADEGRTGALPVIVQPAPRGDGATTMRAPDWASLGVDAERTLESIGAVAGDVDVSTTADGPAPSWALLDALGADAAARPRASSAGAPIAKVWLDRRVEPLDADSMPQIGAPRAWEAGHTGQGVTVGVVDTGIDAAHPDLDEGVVAATRDFTGSGAGDQVGHGTHVASIVAGSGEASDGANRGVAPGARLLDAKVLTPEGGDTSWVIDGMEWAAEQGADVLNLSLGEPGHYTDGSDPASLAVDALSEEYGLLAVAAAGNEGPEPGTIPTLGTASSALTVAAVDDADRVADFSSVGPRTDGALKPDIAAPGVGIVAARAAGTTLDEPVDDLHVAASGTSMAAPHVAGAAAVVASARPDLTGQELKSVLMASAQHPRPNSVWQEGAGRAWIPGALAQTVTSDPPSLSFGITAYPQDEAEPVTETVTYRNPGDVDLGLDLTLAVRGPGNAAVPAGTMTASATHLVVPAGGTASVDLTLDAARVPPGAYGGALVARSAEGDRVRTAVGFVNESEKYDLTIRATDVDGSPATSDDRLVLQNAADPFDDLWLEPEFSGGVATVRVDPGEYYLAGFFEARDRGASWPHSVTAVADPTIEVAGDTTVRLDVARRARPLDVTTHRETHDAGKDLSFYRLVDGEYNGTVGVTYSGYSDDLVAPSFYALPTEKVRGNVEFELVSLTQLRQPVLDVEVRDGTGNVPATTVPGSVPVVGRDRVRLVDGRSLGDGGTPDARARGRYVLVTQGSVQAKAEAAEAAGAAGVIVRSNGFGTIPGSVSGVGIPVLATDRDTGDGMISVLESGDPVRLSVRGRDQARYVYDTVVEHVGQVPDRDLHTHAGPRNLARLDMDYRAMSDGGQVQVTPIIVRDGRQGVFGIASDLVAPTNRAEYVTATEGVRWYHQVMPRHTGPFLASAFESVIRGYEPGDRASDVWLAQAHHGGFSSPRLGTYDGAGGASAVRDFDSFAFELPLWVDDAGHAVPIALPSEEQARVRMRLWQDGTKVLDRPDTFGWLFGLPEEPTRYRLRADVARSTPWWQLSTRVATEWAFTSAFADDRVVLPLLQVDYGLSLDRRNQGGRTERLRLSVSHQEGSARSEVRGLRLWSSPDDGATWTPVDVRERVGGFAATVRVPRGTEHVSLRAEAWDAAGSRIKETVVRAYAVR